MDQDNINRLKILLTDAVVMLCSNVVKYSASLKIQGFVVITADVDKVGVVEIGETLLAAAGDRTQILSNSSLAESMGAVPNSDSEDGNYKPATKEGAITSSVDYCSIMAPLNWQKRLRMEAKTSSKFSDIPFGLQSPLPLVKERCPTVQSSVSDVLPSSRLQAKKDSLVIDSSCTNSLASSPAITKVDSDDGVNGEALAADSLRNDVFSTLDLSTHHLKSRNEKCLEASVISPIAHDSRKRLSCDLNSQCGAQKACDQYDFRSHMLDDPDFANTRNAKAVKYGSHDAGTEACLSDVNLMRYDGQSRSSAAAAAAADQFICQFADCGLSFSYKRSLDRHQRTKHGARFGCDRQITFSCQLSGCRRVFYALNTLAKHQKDVHNFIALPIDEVV